MKPGCFTKSSYPNLPWWHRAERRHSRAASRRRFPKQDGHVPTRVSEQQVRTSSGAGQHGGREDLLQDLGDLLRVHGNEGSPGWKCFLESEANERERIVSKPETERAQCVSMRSRHSRGRTRSLSSLPSSIRGLSSFASISDLVSFSLALLDPLTSRPGRLGNR